MLTFGWPRPMPRSTSHWLTVGPSHQKPRHIFQTDWEKRQSQRNQWLKPWVPPVSGAPGDPSCFECVWGALSRMRTNPRLADVFFTSVTLKTRVDECRFKGCVAAGKKELRTYPAVSIPEAWLWVHKFVYHLIGFDFFLRALLFLSRPGLRELLACHVGTGGPGAGA